MRSGRLAGGLWALVKAGATASAFARAVVRRVVRFGFAPTTTPQSRPPPKLPSISLSLSYQPAGTRKVRPRAPCCPRDRAPKRSTGTPEPCTRRIARYHLVANPPCDPPGAWCASCNHAAPTTYGGRAWACTATSARTFRGVRRRVPHFHAKHGRRHARLRCKRSAACNACKTCACWSVDGRNRPRPRRGSRSVRAAG
jgi:hypothetical protein